MKVRCLAIMKRQIIIWLAVLLATSLLLRASREYLYEPVETSKVDTLSPLIDKLAMCESGGDPMALNPQDGGSRSSGVLQFKDSTFIHYAKRYQLFPNAEDAEILNFLNDAEYQKQLAKLMLDENPNNWRHWYNCSLKTGLNKLTLSSL